VIPPSFTYLRASSVDEALGLAAEHGEDAKYLAGGHSLLPMMKLRLAFPEVLIDLGRITELSYVRDGGTHVAVGAMTRHHDVATSALLTSEIPLLAHTAGEVGDPQIRHRGTIGGSVAHGDAASDLPAALLALDATFVIRGASGTRSVPAADFFTGIFETAIGPGELLTEIQVPKPARPSAWSFQKFTKRKIDWAIVGGADQHGPDPAARRRGRVGARVRCVDRRRVRPGRRGDVRRRRHPRQQGLPGAPRPGPGPARSRGGGRADVSRPWSLGHEPARCPPTAEA
jgi:carbon-monoxide dehydrogenase medium subunit